MNKAALMQFEQKYCRVVLENGFALRGVILSVQDDFITFRTSQTTSVIHFQKLREVYEITKRF